MPRLLIVYKDIPHIINHNFSSIEKITYIVVFKTGELSYERKDFQSIEGALDFEPQSDLKFVFIHIQETIDKNSLLGSYCRQIKFTNDNFVIDDKIDLTVESKRFLITFGFEFFILEKLSPQNNRYFYEKPYRCRIIEKESVKEIENISSYYEIIPQYDDIFLETIFMFDIMTINHSVDNYAKLEAYFMQAKSKIESKNPSMVKSGLTAG